MFPKSVNPALPKMSPQTPHRILSERDQLSKAKQLVRRQKASIKERQRQLESGRENWLASRRSAQVQGHP